ncbi:unnamed protein product [Pedinophyceae sp. YPF-701]|nr:unnamed protein product [Pedinophyceae sp. YPF-701]
MPKRKVDIVVADGVGDEERVGPFACHFPSGLPVVGGPIPDFDLYRCDAASGMQRHLLVGTHVNVDYVGDTLPARPPPPCNYAIGLYDRAAGTLTLAPAEGGDVLRCEARVHGVDYSTGLGMAALAPDDLEARRQRNKDLVAAFGSQRRKRNMDKREKGRMDATNLTDPERFKAEILAIREEAERAGETKEELQAAARAQRNIPPHVPAATDPSKAYPLKALIPRGAGLDARAAELEAVAEDDDKWGELKACRFVKQRVKVLRDYQEKKQRSRAAQALAFVDVLLALYRARGGVRVEEGGITSAAEKFNVPAAALEAVTGLLCFERVRDDGSVSLAMDSARRDLCLGYILVATLHAHAFVLSAPVVESLRKELKMEWKVLREAIRVLGCTIEAVRAKDGGEGGHKVSLLQSGEVSLEQAFPKPKIGRARR